MKRWIQLGMLALLISLVIGVVAAQSGYSIVWYTMDGGNATFSAGGAILSAALSAKLTQVWPVAAAIRCTAGFGVHQIACSTSRW